MKNITIFTPTYNRANLLPRVYHSLQSQTNFNFEWLIIDDGSSDSTKELCKRWMLNESKFPIRYFYQENSGKCAAINKALALAHGDWFFVLDSDDFLTDDAVEKIHTWVQTLPSHGKYCAVAGRATYGGSEPDAPFLEGTYLDCTFFDRYPRKENNYFFIGHDRPLVFKTEIHRKYTYPVFQGEKFMTEAVAWNRMAHDGYSVRCFNDIICIYQHQAQGLSMNSIQNFTTNPHGYGLWLWEMSKFLNYTPFNRLKQIYSFSSDMGKRYSSKQVASFIHTNPAIIFVCRMSYEIKHKF